MERLTEKHYKSEDGYYIRCSERCDKDICDCECENFSNIVDRLGQIEDILGDTYDLDRLEVMMTQCMSMREEVYERFRITGSIPVDRLRELVEADKAGRVLPKTSRVRKCPKCGKMNMYPRIDWKYFYCYSCETTFPAEEIIRPKAAIAKEADHE